MYSNVHDICFYEGYELCAGLAARTCYDECDVTSAKAVVRAQHGLRWIPLLNLPAFGQIVFSIPLEILGRAEGFGCALCVANITSVTLPF